MSEGEQEVDIGQRRLEAHAGVPFKQAVIVFFVFYLAAAVLNGRAMYETASRREYGPVRTVWMVATAPLHWVAIRTGTDRLRLILEPLLEDEP